MEKEVNCINSRSIFEYVKTHNGGDVSVLLGDLDVEIDSLPDPEAYLTDSNNWISCNVAAKLFQRARDFFEDDMTAFNIAAFAVEKTALGYTQRIILKAFWSTARGLKNLQKINERWNRNKRIELVDLKKREAVVRLHWNPAMGSTKDFCLMNQGSYIHLPRIWGSSPLTLTERCCFFEGAPYCEYHLAWPAGNRFHELLSSVFTSKSVLRETINEMEKDKKIIEQKYEEAHRLNRELNSRIKQLKAIQETGEAIISVLDLEDLLTAIMNILSNVDRIHRAIILLVNEKDRHLEYLHSAGFGTEIAEVVRNFRVPLDHRSNILARVARMGRSEYVAELKPSHIREEYLPPVHGNPESLYVVPLISRSKVIGVMAVEGIHGRGVSTATRESLDVFAPQMAIAIENAKLYRRLDEKMAALKKSHALLSWAEKCTFLGNFTARLAHEIKNPMTAIGTFLQLLPSKFEDEKFRTDFYNIAMEETERINNLITELLDLVRTREPHFEPDGLHRLIDKMIFLISPQALEKKIEVRTDFDPTIGVVYMDSEKVKQVMLNLLSNAVDFTPDGGGIFVSTKRIPIHDASANIVIKVQDTGAGIPPDRMARVFDPYFTTKDKSHMHKGTGLGLFIAHQNIQEHKGAIEVESEIHKGTVFTITIPEKPAHYSEEPVSRGGIEKRLPEDL